MLFSPHLLVSTILLNQVSCVEIVDKVVDKVTDAIEFTKSLVILPNYTGYMLWNMIPDESREEILNFYVKGVKCSSTDSTVVKTVETNKAAEDLSEKDFSSSDFITINEETFGGLWHETAGMYLTDDTVYNVKSQITLFATILEKAPLYAIQRILKEKRYCRESILEEIPPTALVKYILNIDRSGADKVALFQIIQMYSDFDFGELSLLNLIRDAAFCLEDKDLVEFTDEYPDVLETNSLDDQERVMREWQVDHFPKLWDYVCSNAECTGAECKTYPNQKYMKFNTFSEGIDVKDWNIAMFATACQRYDEVCKMPNSLLPKASKAVKDHKAGDRIKCMEHLIPMIKDQYQRDKLCQMFEMELLPAMQENIETYGYSGQRINLKALNGVKPERVERFCQNSMNDYSIYNLVDDFMSRPGRIRKLKCHDESFYI